MTSKLEPLKRTKTILLTTYKRDGTAIGKPVSIAFADDRAFFRTPNKAWKAKRLRNDPRVQAAAATFRGKPVGPPVHGRATLLGGEQAEIAARALARRQRVLHGQPGTLNFDAQGGLVNVFVFEIVDGFIQAIRSIINPDKLGHLGYPLSDLGRRRPAAE